MMESEYTQIKNTEPSIKTDVTISKEGLEQLLIVMPKCVATAILEELPTVESNTSNNILEEMFTQLKSCSNSTSMDLCSFIHLNSYAPVHITINISGYAAIHQCFHPVVAILAKKQYICHRVILPSAVYQCFLNFLEEIDYVSLCCVYKQLILECHKRLLTFSNCSMVKGLPYLSLL